MPVTVAFLDASVLYPAPLRDLLLELAVSDLFRAKWSASVHEKWIRALLRRRPDLTAERLERTRGLMDAHVRDALVTGFEDLIGEVQLPDPDDRHVLAAAVVAGADIIVTANLRLSGPDPRGTWTRTPASGRLLGRPVRPVAHAVPRRGESRPRSPRHAPPRRTERYGGSSPGAQRSAAATRLDSEGIDDRASSQAAYDNIDPATQRPTPMKLHLDREHLQRPGQQRNRTVLFCYRHSAGARLRKCVAPSIMNSEV